MQDSFSILKSTCKKACRNNHACAEGYRQMLESENISQMMSTWRNNWEDIVGDKYADEICNNLPRLYESIKDEMNRSGVYLNECPIDAKNFTRVLITKCNHEVNIHGYAKAYILEEANVVAHEHSQVYNNRCESAKITLHDCSFGNVMAGDVFAFDRSVIQCNCRAYINGYVTCDAFGGRVDAMRYNSISAYGDTLVRSKGYKGIATSGESRIEIVKTFNDE